MIKRQYIDIGRRERIPFILADFLIDNYHKIFKKKQKPLPNLTAPKILIFANGHLGDALQISYLFPLIKKKFSAATIHLVAPSWCDVVWKHNSLIDSVTHLDEAASNRGKGSKFDKQKIWLNTTQSAIKKLKNETFDFAIDVRYSNHHFLYLLPFLNIKQAIGYGTRGLGGFLDIELPLPPQPRHNMDWLLQLLEPMGIKEKTETIVPVFEIPESIKKEVDEKIKNWNIGQSFYLILPEAGTEERMLDVNFWINLIKQKINHDTDCQFLVIGLTDYCNKLFEEATKLGFGSKVVNLKSLLNIHEIAFLAQKSNGAYCLDSFPVHLCAVFCPVVAYFYKVAHLLFLPINNYPIYIYHHQNPADWKLMNRKGFHNAQVANFDDNLIKETVFKI